MREIRWYLQAVFLLEEYESVTSASTTVGICPKNIRVQQLENRSMSLDLFGDSGEIDRYNVYHVSLIVRHSEDNKMYLYDIIDIKKETGNPFEL